MKMSFKMGGDNYLFLTRHTNSSSTFGCVANFKQLEEDFINSNQNPLVVQYSIFIFLA